MPVIIIIIIIIIKCSEDIIKKIMVYILPPDMIGLKFDATKLLTGAFYWNAMHSAKTELFELK